MTAHSIRKKPARGHRPVNKEGVEYAPRITVSIVDKDFRVLSAWAAKNKRPVAEEIRRAVWAYIYPIRADFEKGHAP